MKKLAVVMIMAAWAAVLRLDAADVKEKLFQFALTATASIGSDFEGELGGLIGPGVRADLALGRELMITLESMYILYWHAIAPAATLNLRIGEWAYVGAGVLTTWATWDGAPVTALKARLGMKGSHVLFEFHYIAGAASSHTWGGAPRLIGVTIGYVF